MLEPSYLADNPFFILELPRDCSTMDVERAGQKLLSMLRVGLVSATTYKTPLGERSRDEDAVRRAMATLRDPEARPRFEAWVRDDVWHDPNIDAQPNITWADAHRALGTLDR